MLQIKDIRKEYRTGDLVQKALDGVSLTLRDNEFVAILGPSGSGKTTLLNVIGGLDRYDSGDLIINNISTRKYSDRDWDSYRNHTIGFVFQSYNLIPHQTVLANVELALTISGVSRAEKRRRAKEALTKVGLGDQLHKKPNQMSGGQMQRVAIARALVNDPDILLADEPTGALDTTTSVQVMDLLKEVARDRLVVMVTHNPELADQYATRIVQLRDGRIISDSDPVEAAAETAPAVHKNMGKASMSFFTALALSFNNLWTKRGRTILTAFAGSIGIIGIALILSLSNGANTYIKNIEEDTLSEYPITISSSGLDYSSVFSQMADARASESEEDKEERQNADVVERHTLNTMFAGVSSNDLRSFKTYLDANRSRIDSLSTSMEYKYSVRPIIYRLDGETGYRQVHPDQTLNNLGVSYGSFSSFAMMDSNIFFSLPQQDALYQAQYDVKAGRWPKDYTECVLVLSGRHTIQDLVLYAIGLKDASELDAMIQRYNSGEDVSLDTDVGTYKYEDFLGREFSLINAADLYEYDETYKVYVDKTENQSYMRNLVENGEKITLVGVVSPMEDANATMLSYGLGYHYSLLEHTMELSAESAPVKAQLADPDTDVFTGKPFGEQEEENPFDLSSIFSVDADKLMNAFSFDGSALNIDLSGLTNLDLSSVTIDFSQVDLSELRNVDLREAFKDVDIFQFSGEELQAMIQKALDTYAEETDIDPAEDRAGYALGFAQFVATEEGRAIIREGLEKVFNTEGVRQQISDAVQDVSLQAQPVIQEQIGKILSQVISQLSGQLQSKMSAAMAQLSRNIQNAFKVDIDAFTGAITINLDASQLQEIMLSMMSKTRTSLESNLSKLNYADKSKPSSILIYPRDFESKNALVGMINEYNTAVKAAGEDDKVITYTDYVATLMSSVTTIVDTISYVLIAFVAISLVVSSIMIGIITYISVLERTKEIGILRAIGASKRNVSQVFNAETFIIGLLSGLIGVGVSLLLLIPGNALIHNLAGNNDVSAILPPLGGVALVIISVLLTLIGGLIPSRAAARKDPVRALRTE